ncbi:hypothetical protein GCM10009557_47250 [Virgisporangium ochraceum]|uniref:Uncharacterized protein n=1 Tax=Virgisporangium ochraceum TaxID=65505 RepID=A0A8J4EHN0_9ACTN|nr:hypothetical protein Voc01_100760 [Virgisporangium ochraceum]
MAAPSGARSFLPNTPDRRHDVSPIHACGEPTAAKGRTVERNRERVTMASIVLRVRLLNGDRLDVTYGPGTAVDAAHALEDAVASLSADRGA